MELRYKTSTVTGHLRVIHRINIDGEEFETTRAKDILIWAKPRIHSKFVWKQLKESVRLGEVLTVDGGGLFDKD